MTTQPARPRDCSPCPAHHQRHRRRAHRRPPHGVYRAVGQAEAGPDLQHVIATWWGQAMLDTDPDRDRIIAAVQGGTMATVTMAEVIRRRYAGDGAMPGERR
jgi:hypothetical protein